MPRQNNQSEIDAIHALRDRYPEMSQTSLARRIGIIDFCMPENVRLATAASKRPYLSTYSVIRRYDAKRKAAVAVPA